MVIAHHQDCLCAKQTKFSLLGKERSWGKKKGKCVVIKHQVLPRRLFQAVSDLRQGLPNMETALQMETPL